LNGGGRESVPEREGARASLLSGKGGKETAIKLLLEGGKKGLTLRRKKGNCSNSKWEGKKGGIISLN